MDHLYRLMVQNVQQMVVMMVLYIVHVVGTLTYTKGYYTNGTPATTIVECKSCGSLGPHYTAYVKCTNLGSTCSFETGVGILLCAGCARFTDLHGNPSRYGSFRRSMSE